MSEATVWVPPHAEHPPPKPGEPPLHDAARWGDHAAIHTLVERGAAVDGLFDIGLEPGAREQPATPLMVAAGSGDGASAETVALLLELGADPHLRAGGASAADFACRGLGWNYRPGGDAARLRLLLEAGATLSREGAEGARLVAACAASGDPERLRLVLQAGGPVGAPPGDVSGADIPLHAAVLSGSLACVRLLLEAGADPGRRDRAGRTALFVADVEAMVRLLVSAGCGLEDRDQYGWTPLGAAVSDGALARTTALIAAGADVDARDNRGYTVFMSAVSTAERRPDVMKALLLANADARAVTEVGYTAFHAAIDVNGGANQETSVRSTLALIKEAGVDIEARTQAGKTPLARALAEGSALEVQVLCELGANPDAASVLRGCGGDATRDDEVPLLFHAVTAAVDPDLKTETLLTCGADSEVESPSGHSPLEMAAAELLRSSADYESSFRDLFAVLDEAAAIGAGGFDLPTRAHAFEAVIDPFVHRLPESPSPYAREHLRKLARAVALLTAHAVGT